MATPRTPNEGTGGAGPAIPEAELVSAAEAEVAPVLILTDEPSSASGGAPAASVASVRVEPPRRGSALMLVIGGIVAAVIGFGLSQVVPKGWPLRAETGLGATVAAQAAEIARLSGIVDGLPEPAPPTDLSPLEMQLANLTDRIAAAEASVTAIPAPVTPPDPGPRIGDLEKRVARLEALPPGTVIEGGTGPDPAALAALSQEIATLKADLTAQAGATAAAVAEVNTAAAAAHKALSRAEAEAAALKTQTEATATTASASAALGRIEAAVETGAPFATAVEALTAAGAQVPEPLASAAATGLPRLTDLQASFPDAARAALDESLRAGVGEGTMDRLGAFLRTQTGARSLTPRQGSDPDAILSRAEAALQAGDLTTALAEIATLPEAGQAALATWTGAAQARVAATAALADLSAGLER